MSTANHYGHQEKNPNKQNTNKSTAERIVKKYGGNVNEIEVWLNNHPFVVDGNKVHFKGIDDLIVDISSDNSKKTGDQIAYKVNSKGSGKLLEKVFGVGLGSVMSTTTAWEQPGPASQQSRTYKIIDAQTSLVDYIFTPQGPMQTPNMSNSFSPYSGQSRFDMFYKAK